jgi:hypothetical protein
LQPRGLLDYLESRESVPAAAANAEKDLLTIRNNLEMATGAERDRQPFGQFQVKSIFKGKLKEHNTLQGSISEYANHIGGSIGYPFATLEFGTKVKFPTKSSSKGRATGASTTTCGSEKTEKTSESNSKLEIVQVNSLFLNILYSSFSFQFAQNHARADLIWNEKTRDEFRQAIQNEMRQLQQELEFVQTGTTVAWNHSEFSVIKLEYY